MSFRSCPSCGFLVAADTQICQFCSSDLARADAVVTEPAEPRGVSPIDLQRPPRTPGSRGRHAAVVGVIAAVGLTASAVVYLSGRTSEEAMTAAAPPAVGTGVATTVAAGATTVTTVVVSSTTPTPVGPTTTAGDVPTGPMPAGWIETAATDGTFTGWFPTRPTERTVRRNGLGLMVHEGITADAAPLHYAVMITEDPDLAVLDDAEGYLRTIASVLADGRRLERADFAPTASGRPALDVAVAADGYELLVRLQLAGDRLVTIQASGPAGEALQRTHAGLVDGFRWNG